MKQLELTAEEALAQDQVDGLVVAFPENERPLGGLAATLDWRLRGAISRAIEIGQLQGKAGEVTLVPHEKQGRIIPILLVGAGSVGNAGEREGLPPESIHRLRENLAALGKFRWALSRADLGTAASQVAKQFHPKSGGELWLTR